MEIEEIYVEIMERIIELMKVDADVGTREDLELGDLLGFAAALELGGYLRSRSDKTPCMEQGERTFIMCNRASIAYLCRGMQGCLLTSC